MRFEINIPNAIIEEVRESKDGKDLFEVIETLIRFNLYYDMRSSDHRAGEYFGTLVETIEPIGYRINISKSPTPDV